MPDEPTLMKARVQTVDGVEAYRGEESWSADDHAAHEIEINALLAEGGLPPRPAGRRWFLLLPAGYVSIDQLLNELIDRTERESVGLELTPRFVSVVAGAVDDLLR